MTRPATPPGPITAPPPVVIESTDAPTDMRPTVAPPGAVETFLRQGGSVCPFAKGSQRIYAESGKPLLPAAEQFAATQGKNPNGALLVLGPPDMNFSQTKTWARETFLDLWLAFGVIAGARMRELAHYITHHVRAVLFDDENPVRPVLSCRSSPLFAICMAPVYPRTHPRYAPRPVVVVTWQQDVGDIQREAAPRIREAMKREHGFVYDADALMLPMPEIR